MIRRGIKRYPKQKSDSSGSCSSSSNSLFSPSKSNNVVFWLKHEAGAASNILPTKRGTTHLQYRTRRAAYEEFCKVTKASGLQGTSYALFCDVWKNSDACRDIKTERKTGTLSKCNKCQLYKRKLENTSPHDKDATDRIRALFRAHLIWALIEKFCYYDRKFQGIINAARFLSGICDGATQRVYMIPRYGEFPKEAQEFLPQSILAVLFHGHGTFLYPRTPWVRAGSNFTIQCLSHALELLSQSELYKDSGLPPDLFLQMDNCSGDNKNKYILAWGSLLVQDGVFETVSFSFLLVGHTHEDIDAVFARIGKYLAGKSILTPEEFDTLLAKALSGTKENGHAQVSISSRAETNVHVKRFDGTANFKSLLEPCVDDKVSGIKVPLHFLIYADSDEFGKRVARMKYRGSWSSEKWFPQGADGCLINIEDHYAASAAGIGASAVVDIPKPDSSYSGQDMIMLNAVEQDALLSESLLPYTLEKLTISPKRAQVVNTDGVAAGGDTASAVGTVARGAHVSRTDGVAAKVGRLDRIHSGRGVFSLFTAKSLESFTASPGMQWNQSHARLEDVQWCIPAQIDDKSAYFKSLEAFLSSEYLKAVCKDDNHFETVQQAWSTLVMPTQVEDIIGAFEVDWKCLRHLEGRPAEAVNVTTVKSLLAADPSYTLASSAEILFNSRNSFASMFRAREDILTATKNTALKNGDFVIALRNADSGKIDGAFPS